MRNITGRSILSADGAAQSRFSPGGGCMCVHKNGEMLLSPFSMDISLRRLAPGQFQMRSAQRLDAENIVSVGHYEPVGVEVILMNGEPCKHQAELSGGKTAVQHISVQRNNGFLLLVHRMDMRNPYGSGLVGLHVYDNSVE